MLCVVLKDEMSTVTLLDQAITVRAIRLMVAKRSSFTDDTDVDINVHYKMMYFILIIVLLRATRLLRTAEKQNSAILNKTRTAGSDKKKSHI